MVEYIYEVWTVKSPLFPKDPYQRALARFWEDYITKQIYTSGRKVWMTKGEEQETAKKEFIVLLLEGELHDEHYFDGENIGFVDVAVIPFYSWFSSYETCGNFSTKVECPKLIEWATCMESVSKSLLYSHNISDFVLELKKRFGTYIVYQELEIYSSTLFLLTDCVYRCFVLFLIGLGLL